MTALKKALQTLKKALAGKPAPVVKPKIIRAGRFTND